MKVTKLEVQVKNKNRCSVYLDKEYSFGIYLNTLDKYDIFIGKDISEAEKNIILDYDGKLYCFNKGLNLLAYSSKSEKMLREKLKEKEFSKEEIDFAIEKLIDLKYIDDHMYAENFIENRKKRYGPKRLKMELKLKGISEEIIFSLIEDSFDESSEIETALKNSRSKWEKYKNDPKGYEKMCNFLYRRGHSYDVIKKVINKHKEEN